MEVMAKGASLVDHSCQTVGKFDVIQVDQVEVVEEKKNLAPNTKQSSRPKDNFQRTKNRLKTK
jgi:hypothetical protein